MTGRTEEERMMDKIILYYEIPNVENAIFCNTLCWKRGDLRKRNIDGYLLPTDVNVVSAKHIKRKKKKKEKEEEEAVERGRGGENSKDISSV